MSYLFLDSVSNLKYGLIDNQFKWIEFVETNEIKSSAVIHKLIYELAQKYHIDLKKLTGIIKVSGPGSYTGMRVAEGVSNIFEWQGVSTFAFYLYEIPELTGVSQGHWLSNAFKGETFIYSWDKNKSDKKLSSKDLDQLFSSLSKQGPSIFSTEATFLEMGAIDCYGALRNQEKELFQAVVHRGEDAPPFYYRSLEAEFKQAKS